MSLFGNGNQRQGQRVSPMQAWQQFQQNPIGQLRQIGFNIPDGLNSGQEVMQHLVQTGQVPQGHLQQVMQMMGQMMGRR